MDLEDHLYCLLYWYHNERNWSIQSTSTITRPRCESYQYKEGDLVTAKFRGKPYKAAIVRIRANKEDLQDEKIKLEQILQNLELSPSSVMSEMDVIVKEPEKMNCESHVSDKDDMSGTRVTNSTSVVQSPQAIHESTTNKAKSPQTIQSTTKKSKSPQAIQSSTKKAKKNSNTKRIETENNVKKSKIQNENTCNDNMSGKELKEQQKKKQAAAIEAAKIMAKRITATVTDSTTPQQSDQILIQQTGQDHEQTQTPPRQHTIPQPKAHTEQQPKQQSKQPQHQPFQDQESQTQYQPICYGGNSNYAMDSSSPYIANMTYSHDNYYPCPSKEDSSWLSCVRDASNIVNGFNEFSTSSFEYNGNVDHSDCNQRITELEERVQFLEGNMIKDFMDKLASSARNTLSTFTSSAVQMSRSASTNGILPDMNMSRIIPQDIQDTNSCEKETPLSSPSAKVQMVDLIPGSSTVKISTAQLLACRRKAKGSGTAMARLLLIVYFDVKRLQESCARGTGASGRKPLNPDICDAIIECSMKYSEGRCSEKEIVQAINGKCSDIRQEVAKSVKKKI